MTKQGDLQMIDTIAAMIKIQDLSPELFPGQAMSSDSETGRVSARWYRNDDGKPRITYYPASGWLRVEWSAKQFGFDAVDEYLVRDLALSCLPANVGLWRCQRVDYCVDIEVDEVAPYLAAIGQLRAGSMQRHPFDDGVVWKARGRWVKFYDGKKHNKQALRFEVSNYKQSVRYMAEHWFGCDRTVQEMVQPGRALYVLARYWDKLGLGQGFAQQEREVSALRSAFGQRSLAGAIHALSCIRTHGVESYKTLMLMSKSSYYRWSSQLRDKGFVAASDDSLCVLRLPCDSVFALCGQNLKSATAPPTHIPLDKNGQKNWKNLAMVLGVKDTAPRVKYLQEADSVWKPGYSVDTAPREVKEERSVVALSLAPSSAFIGVGALNG